MYESENSFEVYRNVSKFSDRQVWANSADPDQTAPDQGLHCLQFPLHLLDSLLCGRATLLKFSSDYNNSLGVRIFRKFTVHLKNLFTIMGRQTQQ